MFNLPDLKELQAERGIEVSHEAIRPGVDISIGPWPKSSVGADQGRTPALPRRNVPRARRSPVALLARITLLLGSKAEPFATVSSLPEATLPAMSRQTDNPP